MITKIRFDVQILNERGGVIEQYQIPKYDFKKILDKVISSIETGEVYAINIRKSVKLIEETEIKSLIN